MDDIIPQKQCNRCLNWKPKTTEYFPPEKHGKDGLRATCRICRRAEQRKPPKPPETERECKACHIVKPIAAFTHPTKKTMSGTSTDRKCQDCWNDQQKQFRIDHPEQIRRRERVARKQWCNRNREHIRARNRNRLALQKNAQGKHTAQDIQRQYQRQKGKCYYCHQKLTTYHVDHVIPLIRGGSNGPDNLVIACPHCNTSKNDRFWRLL